MLTDKRTKNGQRVTYDGNLLEMKMWTGRHTDGRRTHQSNHKINKDYNKPSIYNIILLLLNGARSYLKITRHCYLTIMRSMLLPYRLIGHFNLTLNTLYSSHIMTDS